MTNLPRMLKRINNRIMKERRKDLRGDATKTERILWQHLHRSQLGFKFRRQISFDYFIADFYCPSVKLVVEIDGDSHFEPGADVYDEERTARIAGLGVLVIRFTNQDVLLDLERVLAEIRAICVLRSETPLLSEEGLGVVGAKKRITPSSTLAGRTARVVGCDVLNGCTSEPHARYSAGSSIS